ncbi:MAG: glutamate racemase [Saprospiraceae bacterium]
MKIAFFDSGIGGLTVMAEALRLFPNEDYLYFSDALYAPYGSRSPREVKALIIDAVDFLASKNIDILVIACHTASRLMATKLRSRNYPFKIIEMQAGIAGPTYLNRNKKNLICATDLSRKIWKEQLSPTNIKADYLSLQELVVFAENFEFDSAELFEYLFLKFATINWDHYHSVVLGCTHFPFFKNQLQSILPKSVQVIDGSLATAKKIGKYIQPTPPLSTNAMECFISKTSVDTAMILKYLEVLEHSYQPVSHSSY